METICNNPDTYEWNDSLTGDFLWSNVNFGEAVTETMTPLTWSVIRFTLDDWIFLPGYSTIGNIGGFLYLNISVFATLFRMLGRDQEALLKYMEATLYMRLPKEMRIPLIPVSAGLTFSSLLSSMGIEKKHKDSVKRLPVYLADNLEWFERMRSRIHDVTSQSALAALWENEISPHIKGGVRIVRGMAMASSNYTMKLRRRLVALIGEEDASALIANLNEDATPLASLGPITGIARVASGEWSRAAYLEQFGHRGPHEFELSVPRPVENPQWLDRELEIFKASPVDIAMMLQKQKEAFQAARLRLNKKYPLLSARVQREISESARRARLREQARSAYVRDRWLIRLFALRVAELSGIGDDVFFLYLEEILALLKGEKSALQLIPSRRENYQRFKSLPTYPSTIRGKFDPFQWATNPQRASDIFNAQEIHLSEEDRTIRGAAGSAGKVEGNVRRLDSAAEGAALKPGEILVTSLTDISWTPLFPRLAAVVTDVGAPLSHAAIVARELGIPAVVGCGNATARLKTGDRVRVDGSRGVVDIIERGNQQP
jgi:phosphohistidine swiveling domain-containing protein